MSKFAIITLAEEVRSDAVHGGVDINTILRKCKVLAGEIGSSELDQWSTWESLGYPTDQPVPYYRLLPLELTGRFAGPFGLVKTAPVPLTYLPDYARNFRDAYECRESATLIEQSLLRSQSGIATIDTGSLHQSVGRSLFRGYKCTSIKAEVSSAKLVIAIHAVRDHVLNVTNTLLQQYREALQTEESPDVYRNRENKGSGLAVRRTPEEILQEDLELEQAWARVRHMYGSTK